MKKHFLAQFVLELESESEMGYDVSDVKRALQCTVNLDVHVTKHRVSVFPLAGNPADEYDISLETYRYSGYEIEIYQNAHTVASDVPSYFATAMNLSAKQPIGSVVGHDTDSISEAKRQANEYVDKRLKRKQPTPGK